LFKNGVSLESDLGNHLESAETVIMNVLFDLNNHIKSVSVLMLENAAIRQPRKSVNVLYTLLKRRDLNLQPFS
jgi:hypothetical protein